MNEDKKQDERILKLEVRFQEFCDRFDKFVNNDFKHFQKRVEKSIKNTNEKVDALSQNFYDYKLSNTKWLVGILVSIVLMLVALLANLANLH